jgi:anti-sigma B factor antagonist
MADFSADVRERAGTTVLDLHGDLDGLADATVSDAYAQASASSPQALVLNFADVAYINSTGIALIVRMLAEARRSAIAVRVVGLSDHYRHIFEITRLSDLMTFFASEDEAVGDGLTAPA